ncbi:sorting and assembly machinery component 50 homolog B-like [Sipha flava]|jgi:outer membrane protein insertion porin family|uniref:Sorting and assembly machinery component 50 B n=1 Tax=Sipha flava TaxID=143950 RepID=A0A2S2RB96_9HEMI|nr:sorting and assembly machinery component 50 homolog B-like [Sipha flava]
MVLDTTSLIKTKPIRVDRVDIIGLKRTKDDIVKKATECLFDSESIGDVISKTIIAKRNLMQLDCFNDVSANLDVDNVDGQDRYYVTIKVQESNRVKGHVKLLSDAHFDNNPDPKLSTGISFLNLFCRGEKLNVVSDIYSTDKKFSTGSICFTKPLLALFNPYFYATVFKNHYNRNKFGYSFDEYGVNTGFNLSHEYFKVNFGWEGVARELNYAQNTPFGIREQLGLTMKSSVKVTASYDTRDNSVFPSYGSLVQWISEIAGIGGSHEFLKNELFLQYTLTTILASAFTGSFSFGVLDTFGKSSILDNFYLGGPLTFRGFEECGVGKKEDGSITGSSMYWRFNFHIHTPLPFLSEKNKLSHLIRIHLFMNSGNVGNRDGNLTKDLRGLINNIRLSCGAGFALNINNLMRLEINYCLPVCYSNNDSIVSNKSQWGFGLLFF